MKYEALRVYQNAFNKIKFPDQKLESKYAIKYCETMQPKVQEAVMEVKKEQAKENNNRSLFTKETKEKYAGEEQ